MELGRIIGLVVALTVGLLIVRDAHHQGRNWGVWLALMIVLWPAEILGYAVLRLTGRWKRNPALNA